jgi:hypothetical protein
MIARSFRPVGWVAAVGAAALGCYMLSLRVAAERADLSRLDGRIIAASQSIRSLQTELGTRGRMQQLEAWNEEVLALSAPVSGQFVEGNVSLARFDIRQPQIAPAAEVRLAVAVVPAAPAAQAPAAQAPAAASALPPLVRRASAILAPKPRPAAAPRAAVAEPVRTAAAPPPRSRPAATPARTATAQERTRTPATSPRTRSAGLLDDRTLRDLSSASRSERGGGTGN